MKYHNGGKMPGICTRKLHLHVAPQKESDGHMAKKKKLTVLLGAWTHATLSTKPTSA